MFRTLPSAAAGAAVEEPVLPEAAGVEDAVLPQPANIAAAIASAKNVASAFFIENCPPFWF
ncbi:hypothetical protein SDC9_96630 [bioreactor metagenome]|uniref:Uncharacterized protein n=1 Tax=bioreactor metagenome TaxID=1076179 RepID=A0A645AAF2_9ZZZZ